LITVLRESELFPFSPWMACTALLSKYWTDLNT
jgi:hypothetical protein